MTTPPTNPRPASPSPTTTPAGARIVVGVDGSVPSLDALRWAGQAGSALGLAIDAVTCWSYPVNFGMGGGFPGYRPDEDAKRALDEALVTVFGASPPAGLRASVREGYPANELIEASRGAAMLVVGSRGHGGFVGLLIGSVSAYCAEHAKCPVMVLHPRADSEPG
jgi:nucleotide-binding universal stress UspA family protein